MGGIVVPPIADRLQLRQGLIQRGLRSLCGRRHDEERQHRKGSGQAPHGRHRAAGARSSTKIRSPGLSPSQTTSLSREQERPMPMA